MYDPLNDFLFYKVMGEKGDEVQLRNEHNMDKRSLFYWSEEFVKSLKKGQDYIELPDVIAINIVDFDYINTRSFHSCFHLRDDNERDVILTNSLEIHFINMVKYRKMKGKLNDSLSHWLTWFDRNSTPELLEEVLKMDNAIQTANERLLYVTGDEDAQREYLVRFRAMCDMTSMKNAAHREGVKEGLAQGREEILKLFDQGLSVDEIKERLKRQITDNK